MEDSRGGKKREGERCGSLRGTVMCRRALESRLMRRNESMEKMEVKEERDNAKKKKFGERK